LFKPFKTFERIYPEISRLLGTALRSMWPWRFHKYFGEPDLAIDLGTANTRLYVLDRGIVVDEPTRVDGYNGSYAKAVNPRSGHAAAPLRGGVVDDIDATAQLLGRLLRRACGPGLSRSKVIVCAPSDATPAERVDLVEAVRRTGIARVKVMAEPLAAAIGAGLDITSPYAQMLVDIGDGVTDVAVIRSRELVVTHAVRRASGDLSVALQQAVLQRRGLVRPRPESDRLVRESGANEETQSRLTFSASAFDRRGAQFRIEFRYQEICEAIYPIVTEIVNAVRQTLKRLPADLWVEVVESGIILSGGGACLQGIDRLIARETSTEVKIAANPLRATIEGAGEILAGAREAGLWETSWHASREFGE
jgi:rod shape-determining protein MreB